MAVGVINSVGDVYTFRRCTVSVPSCRGVVVVTYSGEVCKCVPASVWVRCGGSREAQMWSSCTGIKSLSIECASLTKELLYSVFQRVIVRYAYNEVAAPLIFVQTEWKDDVREEGTLHWFWSPPLDGVTVKKGESGFLFFFCLTVRKWYYQIKFNTHVRE